MKSRKKLRMVAPANTVEAPQAPPATPSTDDSSTEDHGTFVIDSRPESPVVEPAVSAALAVPAALGKMRQEPAKLSPLAARLAAKGGQPTAAPKAPPSVETSEGLGWSAEHSKRLKWAIDFYELSMAVDREVQHLVIAMIALSRGDFETAGLNFYAAGLTEVRPDAVDAVEVEAD